MNSKVFVAGLLLAAFIAPAFAQEDGGELEGDHRPPVVTLVPVNPDHLIEKFFHQADWGKAKAIMQCESGGNPDAWNKTTDDRGLFQHHYPFWEERSTRSGYPGDPFNPEINVAVAAWLAYEGQGWTAWNASKHCWAGASVEPIEGCFECRGGGD